MHIATVFLPNECPLVGHVVNSYIKNYLREKIKNENKQKNKDNLMRQESNPKSRQSLGSPPSHLYSSKNPAQKPLTQT